MAYSSQSSKAEYTSRINRVIDYIEKHIDADLNLEELAKIACFSSFHFHRIFKTSTGESLYQFILRLRLEKSAAQLIQLPQKSITAIAIDCGFGSSANFARSFRAAFGMSASEWRASKNCITDSKTSNDTQEASGYSCSNESAFGADVKTGSHEMRFKEAQSISVENRAETTLAYVRHIGPYAGDSELFVRLFGQICKWAGARELLGPSSKVLTIYHDNPEITEEDKLRISVGVEVPPETKAEGEIGIMKIPAGRYAVAQFEIDTEEFGAAWSWVYGKWLPESGFQPDDRPCFEVCLNDCNQHPQKKHQVLICAPVKPL